MFCWFLNIKNIISLCCKGLNTPCMSPTKFRFCYVIRDISRASLIAFTYKHHFVGRIDGFSFKCKISSKLCVYFLQQILCGERGVSLFLRKTGLGVSKRFGELLSESDLRSISLNKLINCK